MLLKKTSLAALTLVLAVGCSQKINSDGSLVLGQGNGPGGGGGSGDGDGSTPAPGPTLIGNPVPIGLGSFEFDPKKTPGGTSESPNGLFRSGDETTVSWVTNGSTSGTLDLYYSKDQGVNWTLIPPPDRPLNGNFKWTLPNETIGMDQVGICKGRFKAVIKSTNPAQTVESKPSGKDFCIDNAAPVLTNTKIYPKTNPDYSNDPIKVAPTEAVYIDYTVTDDVGLPPKPGKLFCRSLNGTTLEENEITSNISQSALGSNKYRITWNVPANTKCISTAIKVKDLAGREVESPDLKGIDVGAILPPNGVQVKIDSFDPLKGADVSTDAPNGFYRSTNTPSIAWTTVGSESGKVELYFSKDRGAHWTLMQGNLPLSSSTVINFPQETVGFDNDTSRKCKGRFKVVTRSTNPNTTKESIYNTDVCVDSQVPKFLNASVYDPQNKNSSADPILIKPGKGVLFQFRLSDDVGFSPKAVSLYCRLDDNSETLIGSNLDSTSKSLGVLWVVPENTKCKKTLLKVVDLAGKEATVELKGVQAEATLPPSGVNLKVFELNPEKGPASTADAPSGLYDSKDKPKVKLETEGSKDGKIDLYYRVRPATAWILIKKDLPLTALYDWTLPDQSIGMDDQGRCNGQLMARIRSVDPSVTKDILYNKDFCVDKTPPKIVSASIYPKNEPNYGGSPISVKAGDTVVIPYVFSDDVGISPNNRTELYCKKGIITGGMTQISSNLAETKVGNKGTLEWTVPAGTSCLITVLKVTDLSGKSTLLFLKGVKADGTEPPSDASCKPGINLGDSDLLGYYCLNKNFDDAGPRKNHLIKGELNPSFENRPMGEVAIKADPAFGKAAHFDGRSFAVAKQLNDFPVNDQPRTVMTWIYSDESSWLKANPQMGVDSLPPNRQSTVFHYGKTWEAKRDFGLELCCREGCKCPTPSRPVTVLNTYTWDVDTMTSPSELMGLTPGIPAVGWWHYAVTYSGSTGKKLIVYVNGKKVTEKQQESLETVLTDLRIGTGEPAWEPGEPGKFLKGKLVHFGFLKRALTPEEIKKEYDETKPKNFCDPFTAGTKEDRGLKGKITYWNGDTQYNDPKFRLDFYVPNGNGTETAVGDLYLNNLAVTSRKFTEGFPYEGGILKTNTGENLIEFFGFNLESKLFLPGGVNTIEKEYRIAFIVDDGVRFEIKDPNAQDQWISLAETTESAPNRVVCTRQKVKLTSGIENALPIRVRYHQAPREHITLMMLWKEIDKNNPSSFEDPYCLPDQTPKVFEVDALFDTNNGSLPLQPYKDFLNRGWKIIPTENFFVRNPCAK
jgi:hypothetical protein